LGVENMLNYINAAQMPNIAGRIYFVNVNYSLNSILHKSKNTRS
jgi:hypothetical protein